MRWGKAGDVAAGGKQSRLEGYEDGTNLEKCHAGQVPRSRAKTVLIPRVVREEGLCEGINLRK